ncbi:MAG: tripartite tricarboxylate transporter substrate binding protein [Burkholderiales bacterium]|nr:tripartite tricarboxylate transporter substrate binding protein [Burkholderiales bacterium]
MTRFLGGLAALAVALASAGAAAQAQVAAPAAWPSKPVRLIVTFPPGGSTDAVVRIMAPKLGERLGQQVVVDNRPGAGGNIGLAALAKSEADGYTIGVGAAGGLAANASLYPKMPFDVQKDFVPISLLAHIPFVLVVPPGSSAKSVADLLAQAKADPGKVAVGHGGNGTAMHLSVQLMKLMAGVDLTEVAYKGSGPVALDVIGGQVPAGMLDLPSVLQQIKAGKVRALAVTGATRLPQLPDVPTLSEAGVKGYESTGWFGVVAPAATPPAVVARLQSDMRAVLTDPEVIAGARAAGVELSPTTSAEFGRFIASETVKWADVIKRSGTKLE